MSWGRTVRRSKRRIEELQADGYVVLVMPEGVFKLTAKGWAVLSACAERPIQKPELKPERGA